jgi:hypothetical protein
MAEQVASTGRIVAIYELGDDEIHVVPTTSFGMEGIGERADLQRVIRDRIEVLLEGALVITEEFGTWDDSRRRIDLLVIDRDANLVVVELKRGDGALSELQAIRYAAMVSTMTFEQAVAAHQAYLDARGSEEDARQRILDFLSWDDPIEDDFGQSVRILLAATTFPKELTTAVLWLNDNGLDIRCVRIQPYRLNDRILLDVQQLVPLPEATEYQVRARAKRQIEKQERSSGRDFTKFDVAVDGVWERRLAKRQAILRVVRGLSERGVSPEQISEVLDWRSPHVLWRSVAGEVDREEFIARATEAADTTGLSYDPRRWFHDDDELIVFDGRSWAMTKMWGPRTEAAMHSLLDALPGHSIEVRRSDEKTAT